VVMEVFPIIAICYSEGYGVFYHFCHGTVVVRRTCGGILVFEFNFSFSKTWFWVYLNFKSKAWARERM